MVAARQQLGSLERSDEIADCLQNLADFKRALFRQHRARWLKSSLSAVKTCFSCPTFITPLQPGKTAVQCPAVLEE